MRVAVHYPHQVKWICLLFFLLICFIGAAFSSPWCHVWEEGEASWTCDWSRGWWRQLLCHWAVSSCAFEIQNMFLLVSEKRQGWKEAYCLQSLLLPFVFQFSFPFRSPLTFGSFARDNQISQRCTLQTWQILTHSLSLYKNSNITFPKGRDAALTFV